MNREIKFRAWDSDSKSFLKGDFSIGIISGEFRGKYGEVFDNVSINQFTGLKDKNGVDIYAGDILDSVGIVEYLDGCFMASGVPLALSACHRFIKGNIYENQELLK